MALLCILVIHFNATVTGYFTLPNKLFWNTLPFGNYLGDFGSSLFFIVSGAALMLTAKPGQDALTFYKKRARAVYPLFWLAWCVVFVLRFLAKPWYYAGAKSWTLVLSVLGIDQFAVAAGWIGQDFACVGEWFLGTLLLFYLLFPLLRWGLERSPWLCGALVLAVSLLLHRLGWAGGIVAVHLPEFFFGMAYGLLPCRLKMVFLPVLALGVPLTAGWDSKIACALLSMAAFILLEVVSHALDLAVPRAVCGELAALSYPVFLLHHALVLRMVEGFDLAALTRRDTAFLFAAYLLLTFASAYALLWLQKRLRSGWQRVFSQSQ